MANADNVESFPCSCFCIFICFVSGHLRCFSLIEIACVPSFVSVGDIIVYADLCC